MIVFTGIAGGFEEARAQLARLGLAHAEMPLLKTEPVASLELLDQAVRVIDRYRAVAITSPRAARVLVDTIDRLEVSSSRLPPVWCGASSVAALAEVFPCCYPADESASSKGLGLSLAESMIRARIGGPVLFPCGESHREELPVRLRAAGRRVLSVVAYRTVLASGAEVADAVAQADVLVIASPRVAALVAATIGSGPHPLILAIGPTTARTAEQGGLRPDLVAASPDAAGVVAALHDFLPSPR